MKKEDLQEDAEKYAKEDFTKEVVDLSSNIPISIILNTTNGQAPFLIQCMYL